MLVRLSGRLIFAIPFNRKWFLINPTSSINTTAGSVNQSKIPQSSNERLEQFLTDLACRHHVSASTGSSREWKQQDPQLPKSIWYHTDAQGLGLRLVRPLQVPPPEELLKLWNNGVEKD